MRHLILCLAAVALGLPAAAAPSAGAPAAHSGPAPANYLFVPGDVLEITVNSHMGYDRTITIQPDGRIQFPLAGEIFAAGQTSAQLATRIEEGLKQEMVDPRVTVSLKEMNRLRRVSVLGAVKTPGTFELKEQSNLAEMLATAGGPTPVADLRHIQISRADGTRKGVVDLSQAARTGEVANNAPLEPGDLVFVPEGAPPTVLLLGEVVKPGSYQLQGESRLLDAISLAGGPTTKADLRRVTLTRSGATGTQSLDLQPLLSGEQKTNPELNVRLQPGDTIVLTETDQRVYVLGRVAKPDTYAIKPDDRVLDALAKAGGAAPDGDISKAVLVRRDGNGQPVAKPLNLKKMMSQARLGENDLLHPGDVLYVPDKKTRRSPGEIAGLIWPLSGLLNIFRR